MHSVGAFQERANTIQQRLHLSADRAVGKEEGVHIKAVSFSALT